MILNPIPVRSNEESFVQLAFGFIEIKDETGKQVSIGKSVPVHLDRRQVFT